MRTCNHSDEEEIFLAAKSNVERTFRNFARTKGQLWKQYQLSYEVIFDEISRLSRLIYIYMSKFVYPGMSISALLKLTGYLSNMRFSLKYSPKTLESERYRFSSLEEFEAVFLNVPIQDLNWILDNLDRNPYFPEVAELVSFSKVTAEHPEVSVDFRWILTVSDGEGIFTPNFSSEIKKNL